MARRRACPAGCRRRRRDGAGALRTAPRDSGARSRARVATAWGGRSGGMGGGGRGGQRGGEGVPDGLVGGVGDGGRRLTFCLATDKKHAGAPRGAGRRVVLARGFAFARRAVPRRLADAPDAARAPGALANARVAPPIFATSPRPRRNADRRRRCEKRLRPRPSRAPRAPGIRPERHHPRPRAETTRRAATRARSSSDPRPRAPLRSRAARDAVNAGALKSARELAFAFPPGERRGRIFIFSPVLPRKIR